MIALVINVRDELSPRLRRLKAAVTPERLAPIGGRAAANVTRQHFFDRNTTHPNKLGGKRTNFWTKAGRATSVRISGDTATISITHQGTAQRYYGGTIRPVNKKFLTIPAVPEAHGKRATEFSDLRFAYVEGRFGGLVPALVRTEATAVQFGRKKKDGTRTVSAAGSLGGEAIYFLVRKVFQKADPTVLPGREKILFAVNEAVTSHLNRFAARAGLPIDPA